MLRNEAGSTSWKVAGLQGRLDTQAGSWLRECLEVSATGRETTASRQLEKLQENAPGACGLRTGGPELLRHLDPHATELAHRPMGRLPEWLLRLSKVASGQAARPSIAMSIS